MPEPSWLEVCLTVDGEMAEAVAEVLSRFAPNGVVIESTQILSNPEDEGHPVGPLRVCAYLPVDERLEETRRKLEESLYYLGRIWPENPLPAPQFSPLKEVNWVESWKQHYRPIPVGRRLMIVPAWMEIDLGGRIPILIEPGMAFGTGTHPTTQLCLEAIEALLSGQRFIQAAGSPLQVIDIGCGSGILSVAALRLGAQHALGVDIDHEAIPVARQNAALNGVSGSLELGVGSVEDVLAGQFSLQKAPLVMANILAPIIVRLLDAGLASLLDPQGVLVLSGILQEQWAEGDRHMDLGRALERHGLKVWEVRKQGDWVALTITRRETGYPDQAG